MNEFEKYLKYENVSPNTGDTYLIADRQYHKWYLESFGEEFTKLYRQNVLEFISYLKNIRNLKYESINVKIYIIRSSLLLILSGTVWWTSMTIYLSRLSLQVRVQQQKKMWMNSDNV